MNEYDILVGAVLIGVGLLIGSASSLTTGGESFVDEYPDGGDWGTFGNFTNTLSDSEKRLVIDDTSENTGTFDSDMVTKDTNFDIDRISYDVEYIDKDQYIDIVIRGYRDGIVQETETIEITEDTIDNGGEYSVSTGSLSEGNYESYDFTVNLQTENSDSPELKQFVITGETYAEEDLLSKAFQWLLIFVGLMVAVRGAY